MKNLKYIGIGLAIVLSLGLSGCGESSDSNSSSYVTHNGTIYGTVTSPYTGKIWLDRNLGASQVCTALDDIACYGDYYQWGRNTDEHEKETSISTSIQATDISNAGTNFITEPTGTYSRDWAKAADDNGSLRTTKWSETDGSSVCPVGFRVPITTELSAETLGNTANDAFTNNINAFNNFLKLPSAGFRSYSNGSVFSQASEGFVWVNDVSGSTSYRLYFGNSSANMNIHFRAYGWSVRCIKD